MNRRAAEGAIGLGNRSSEGGARKRNHRPDLQGMRAVAVLMVFSNHLFEWPSGGFVGVDVFFVLSGFFITGLLIDERTATGTVSFRNFYIRRVKRILPSALLVLTVTVIGSYLLFPATRARSTLVDALYAAVFASNFRFEAIGADYFQQDLPPSPLQHYWSLSIEEQFYFVWPALLVAIFAATRGLRRQGKSEARRSVLFGTMALLVIASFGSALLLSVDDPNRAYFSSLTRVWELGVGALLAIAGPWLTRMPDRIRPLLAYVGLAGVAASLFLIDDSVQFPAPWAALPVLSTALVVASFHGTETRGMSLLTNPVARWFGDTSYTLYLWHWPIIILLLAVLPKGPLFYAVALILSLSLTAITYRFYENPIRKSRWLLDDPEPKPDRRLPALNVSAWAVIGTLAVAAVVLSIATIHHNDKIAATAAEYSASDGPRNKPVLEPGNTGPGTSQSSANAAAPNSGGGEGAAQGTRNAESCFGAPAMRNANCKLRNPGVPLQPSIDEFANDLPRSKSCFGDGQRGIFTCKFGYEGPDAQRIALVGDSHAFALLPAFWEILDANQWNLTVYAGTACDLMDPPTERCSKPMERIRADLLANPYDLVISTSDSADNPPTSFQKAWEPIIAAGSRIAVIADNPDSSKEALECMTRVATGGDKTGDCSTARAYGFRVADPQVAAAQLVPGITVIDLTDYYCTADSCPSVIGDVIVYRDRGHITATFAATLAGPLEAGIKRALSTPRPNP